MGFCEEQKKSEIREISELSRPCTHVRVSVGLNKCVFVWLNMCVHLNAICPLK